MQIRDNSKEAASGLDALAGTLDKVKTAANGFNMRRVSTQLSNLSAVVNGINASGVRRLNDLSFALDRMGKLGNIKISSSVGRQLQSISTAAASLQNVDLSRIAALAETLRPLSELRGSRLTSYINQLGRLPEVIQALERSKLDAFVADIRELTVAMTPLGETMEKVANGFNALPTRIQRMVQQTEKFNDTMRRSNTIMQKSKSGGLWGFLNSTHTKWLAVVGIVGMLSNTLGEFVYSSASLEENLNLFTIAMGRYAEEAYNYAEAVQYALGIDVSAWMRNQGVFMQIATGFGVVEDKAYTMSRGLTQIAYDIASFYNIGVDTAMEKVQSGISGELEPLRRLGYALDAATLQQIAYEHGISQSINTMTQAQKSQLRYIAIMEQSENAMGDMARTIESPANSMRVLAMQAEQLGRAMGNLILPVLTKILPYVQAVTVALTDIINHLAVLSGFTMPEISKDNMGGLASGAESVEDALLGASDAAKELRNATLGLDELNVISESSGVGTAGSGYDLPLDLESYKFFDENYENKVAKMAEEIKDALEPATRTIEAFAAIANNATPILDGFSNTLLGVGESLIGFKADEFREWLTGIGNWMAENPDTLYRIGEGIGAVTTAWIAFKAATGVMNVTSDLFTGVFGGIVASAGNAKGALDALGGVLSLKLPPQVMIAIAGFAALATSVLLISSNWETIKDSWGTTGVKVMDEIELKTKLLGDVYTMVWENRILPIWDKIVWKSKELWDESISPLWDKIKGFGQGLAEIAISIYNTFVLPLSTAIGQYVLPIFTENIDSLVDVAFQFLEDTSTVIRNIIDQWSGITKFLSGVFTLDFGEALDGLKQLFTGMWDAMINSAVAGLNGIIGFINTFLSVARSGINSVIKALNSISVDIPDWVPFFGGETFGVNIRYIPEFSIPLFASGGYPDEGQLFIARERGAEMVGSIGGRTAVANNDQIVEAIRLAVYDAMVAAGGSEGGDTYVYLDSDPVAARIEKRQREKGQKIYSGGVLA